MNDDWKPNDTTNYICSSDGLCPCKRCCDEREEKELVKSIKELLIYD